MQMHQLSSLLYKPCRLWQGLFFLLNPSKKGYSKEESEERMSAMDEFNRQDEHTGQPSVDEQRFERRAEPPMEKKRRGSFLPALFGAIVGGLLVWFLMFTVNPTSETKNVEKTPIETGNSEKVSLDVTTDVTAVVDDVASAVVGITNVQTVRDFWSTSETTQEAGVGSGVIYKKAGDKAYIVTNAHVVENAEQLEITFEDGTKTDGRLIGDDIWTDLAVVEISSAHVQTVIDFGDSDALKRGEPVIAIGNPLGLGFAGSVTVGVVSGKDRSIPIDIDKNGVIDWQADVLQTDAAINPGNSGGALINLAGQLVGINSMKISESTVEGIGLAIPINIAIPIIDHLETTGTVNRPTMGVMLLDVRGVPAREQREVLRLPESVKEGVVVTEILRNSPAAAAGMEKYDVIVEMDGQPIEDMVSLRKHLYNEKEIGDTLKMKIYRDGKPMSIEMVLKDGNTF